MSRQMVLHYLIKETKLNQLRWDFSLLQKLSLQIPAEVLKASLPLCDKPLLGPIKAIITAEQLPVSVVLSDATSCLSGWQPPLCPITHTATLTQELCASVSAPRPNNLRLCGAMCRHCDPSLSNWSSENWRWHSFNREKHRRPFVWVKDFINKTTQFYLPHNARCTTENMNLWRILDQRNKVWSQCGARIRAKFQWLPGTRTSLWTRNKAFIKESE